jgi:DNA-binding IclR family transcriptional regulator
MDRRRPERAVDGEPHRSELVSRILGTFSEMPGLVLRLEQAARLFGLRPRTCEVVLDALLRAGRLRRTADGQYALR